MNADKEFLDRNPMRIVGIAQRGNRDSSIEIL